MKRKKLGFQVIIICVFMLFIMGAKQECQYSPPFDANGDYEGEWWVGQGEHCPVTAEIQMNTNINPLPLWDSTAQFTIDFSCIEWPPELPPLEPMVLDAVGVVDEHGTMTYTAFGCTIALCLFFDSTGAGVDIDSDGLMDTYSGTWDFAILIAGFAPLGVTGEFELNAAPPADDDDAADDMDGAPAEFVY